uniref:Uncharacterized protein n=1 Tax=Glossina austeni TaxID=7395 RepID=A0A1A9VL82_GLOAU
MKSTRRTVLSQKKIYVQPMRDERHVRTLKLQYADCSKAMQPYKELHNKSKETRKTTTWEEQKIQLQQGRNTAKKKAKMVQVYQTRLLCSLCDQSNNKCNIKRRKCNKRNNKCNSKRDNKRNK